MTMTTPADGNGRSVVPLSLTLLIFNVLRADPPRAGGTRPTRERRRPCGEGAYGDGPAHPSKFEGPLDKP